MDKTEREAKQKRWRERLEQWRRGGLSRVAFCRENELSIWQFRYWAKRIADLDGCDRDGFARVTSSGSGLRLSLPGGLILEVEPGFDEATLKRFLRVLSRAC